MFLVMLATGCLLLLEPDFGAFAVITLIAMGILFLGGMNWRLFVGLIIMLAVGFVVLIVTSPYRMQRIVAFMDPWADPYGKGYQLSHALIAFGRGEWLGVGLGSSVEKLFYLPEAHTDFLLAVIGEELGFVGVGHRDRALCADRDARIRHRQPRGQRRALLLRAGGAGHRALDIGAGHHQHGREHGTAADQGADPAAALVRRQWLDGELRRARDPAARRLRSEAVDGRRASKPSESELWRGRS